MRGYGQQECEEMSRDQCAHECEEMNALIDGSEEVTALADTRGEEDSRRHVSERREADQGRASLPSIKVEPLFPLTGLSATRKRASEERSSDASEEMTPRVYQSFSYCSRVSELLLDAREDMTALARPLIPSGGPSSHTNHQCSDTGKQYECGDMQGV